MQDFKPTILVSTPSYDPSDFVLGMSTEKWNSIKDNDASIKNASLSFIYQQIIIQFSTSHEDYNIHIPLLAFHLQGIPLLQAYL